jgi:hypothetical protein
MDSQQALYLYLLFQLGALLQILFQARGSIVARSNSITSFGVWWEYNRKDLGWRLFIDGLLFGVWVAGPEVLGEAAARLIPPCSYAVAPWIGFSADRFTHSLGFILRFTTLEMAHVAPAEVAAKEVQSPDGAAESSRS